MAVQEAVCRGLPVIVSLAAGVSELYPPELSDLVLPDADDAVGLADRLRALHQRSGEYLDQSVRGGSQTDGPLLSRVDPAIQKLRAAIVGAVERYLAQLPQADHSQALPTLSPTLRSSTPAPSATTVP